jgi:hypothetical protein
MVSTPTSHAQVPTTDSVDATYSRKIAEWDDAGFFYKWTYSVVNSMLCRGEMSPLQQGEDRMEDDEKHPLHCYNHMLTLHASFDNLCFSVYTFLIDMLYFATQMTS